MKTIDVTSCQHAGMALSTINPPARNDTWLNRLQSFVTLKPPASYQRAVERWSKLSADLPGLTQRWAITRSSLAIGTGNFSPAENGLSLHGTWGVPYLPGAALKGLASRAATWFDLSPSESEVIFGTTAVRSYVNFNDGWLLPISQEQNLFELDVMTPHAAPYYSSRGKKAPDDSQDPILGGTQEHAVSGDLGLSGGPEMGRNSHDYSGFRVDQTRSGRHDQLRVWAFHRHLSWGGGMT